MTPYLRPLLQTGQTRPDTALTLGGGWTWFTHVELLSRSPGADRVVPVEALDHDMLAPLIEPRASIAGLDMSQARIMGILNVTPDSFSDGGRHDTLDEARDHALAMAAQGANILDIGGESTRPGAETVEIDQEITRTAPVISAIRAESDIPISIDTRKAEVASAALSAGATLVNDVAGFTFDADLAPLCAAQNTPVCVMHAQGDPETMQDDPTYDNVLLDVFDFLADRVAYLTGLGLPRSRIAVDPGIGFGKTLDHNLTLLRNLGLFHALGCPILLGASRKRFIGTIGQAPDPTDRAPGSIAVALAGVAQGAQILRVHDVGETAQALALWQASTTGERS